jgi:hypothetical protein
VGEVSGYRDDREPQTRAGRLAAARREARKPIRLYPRDVPVGAILIVKTGGMGEPIRREEAELVAKERTGRSDYLIEVRFVQDQQPGRWRQAANCKLDVKKGTI